ncbi:MAG: hypothetical protein AABY64_03890 [Bdellovibrionota bacterium]
MKSFFYIFIISAVASIAAAVPNNALYEPKKIDLVVKDNKTYKSCDSVGEFQKALEFLIKKSELNLSEAQNLEKALVVSKGCDGAADRFSSLFLLLKKSGVDLGKSFEVAMVFSQLEDAKAQNFREIFQKAFLENYLNLDFTSAFRLSLELSKDYTGDPNLLRKDFLSFVKFCTSEKEMALTFQACTELVVKMTKYTSMYKDGAFPSFEKLYKYIRQHKLLGLSIEESLNLLSQILSYGPKAPENFQKSIDYSLGKGPIKISESMALSLALALVKHSLKEESMIETDSIKK